MPFWIFLLFMIFQENYTKLCYSCYGESANSSCFTNARSEKWVDCEEGQCQVWKLTTQSDTTNIYMFERSCSGLCRDGCVEIADMGHRFTSCSTCCESNFCNIGSNASSPSILFVLIIFSFFTLLPFTLFQFSI